MDEALVLKTGDGESRSWVRISPHPPLSRLLLGDSNEAQPRRCLRHWGGLLGKALGETFETIFRIESRLVLCLLDTNHRNKIWPTFERNCFDHRVKDGEVIPIFLDETVFPGIPSDIWGIKYRWDPTILDWEEQVVDEIVFRVVDRLSI